MRVMLVWHPVTVVVVIFRIKHTVTISVGVLCW